MTNDYIHREDAIRLAEQGQVQGFPWQFQMLVRLPPADVVPVVHGEWLNAIFDSKRYRCSICNYHISNLVRENYCPNCGAKMDGKGEE